MEKEYDTNISTRNKYGEWVPSIPYPYFLWLGRTRCDCGKTFKDIKTYNGHFALEHILGL